VWPEGLGKFKNHLIGYVFQLCDIHTQFHNNPSAALNVLGAKYDNISLYFSMNDKI
jgi:hypothetical protein